MSDSFNPYESPRTDIDRGEPLSSAGQLTETMILYLKGASPWLRFIGIMGFISCGLCAVSGIGSIAAIPMIPEIPSNIGGLMGVSMGLLYLIAGVLMFFPSRFVYGFGAKIRSFLQNNASAELETAFGYNKSLWKFMGIVTIVNLAFIPVFIIVAVMAAIGYLAF
ncbi:hypothetical protein LJC14_04505 [Treponema sp. OttesenSCG-928-L16]|nr:hypothetical protein [Treponema sp. OttesenSCG-928-L16]